VAESKPGLGLGLASRVYLIPMREPAQKIGRYAGFRASLQQLSARTGAPLPSLILSFGILHEVTAIVPLIAVFYGARTLGIGETIVRSLAPIENINRPEEELNAAQRLMQKWLIEGDMWAERIGRRYGIFGFEKRQPGVQSEEKNTPPPDISKAFAGDVANAVVAYGATKVRCLHLTHSYELSVNMFSKALIPVRIGLSIYLSPAFSRGVVEPVRKALLYPFRRNT
jgi:hypothetical protein